MRILHLIPSLGSGGAERQLSILAPALTKKGIECHVGYCRTGPNLLPLKQTDVVLHHINVRRNHDPRLLWEIWKLIREVRPDLVQTWILQMDVVGGIASLAARMPFIVSERSAKNNYPAGWKSQLRKTIGQSSRCIIANSVGGVDYWREQSAELSVHLLRNFIVNRVVSNHLAPSELFDRVKESPTIMFAGRFSYEKNTAVMMNAVIMALDAVPSATALIFGEGDEELALRHQVAEADLSERIHFCGYSHDLLNWMALSDVCISTSIFEGNPNVVLEAAAIGCPLLISDIPAHREIFDENSVTFADHESPKQFASALISILGEKRVLALEKAKKAKSIVSEYSQDEILEGYVNIYKKVISADAIR